MFKFLAISKYKETTMKNILLLGCLLLVNQLSLASQQEPNGQSRISRPTIAQCNIGRITVINTVPSDIFAGDDDLYREIAEGFIQHLEINVNNKATILLQKCGSSLFSLNIPPHSDAKICVFDFNDHEIALIHITQNDDAPSEVQ